MATIELTKENFSDVVFGKVDTEAQRELAAAFRVMSIPTLVVLREGRVVYARSGALSLEALEDLVARARFLDMDQVRRNRAAHQHPA